MGPDLGLRMNTRVYGWKGIDGVTDTPFQKSQEFLQMVCSPFPSILTTRSFSMVSRIGSLKTEGTPIYRPHQGCMRSKTRSLTYSHTDEGVDPFGKRSITQTVFSPIGIGSRSQAPDPRAGQWCLPSVSHFHAVNWNGNPT